MHQNRKYDGLVTLLAMPPVIVAGVVMVVAYGTLAMLTWAGWTVIDAVDAARSRHRV